MSVLELGGRALFPPPLLFCKKKALYHCRGVKLTEKTMLFEKEKHEK